MGRLAIILAVIVFVLMMIPAISSAQTDRSPSAAVVGVVETTQALQTASPCGDTYTVVLGDTVYRIALNCQVSFTALVAANPQVADPNRIYPGQVLNIPDEGGIPVTGTYVVQAGDTLSEIAQRYNTSIAAIVALNPQISDPDLIYVGQVIALPEDGGIPVTGSYVVRTGDTLSAIARAFGTTVSAILAANPWIANPDLIYPGWVLAIPE
jgi:LysM repeat protein